MGRLVILTGPSCVGKGPLCATLERFYPHIYGRLHELILYNDRAPRPGERDGVDYHFRTRAEIEALRGAEGFAVMDVRGDLQAADLGELRALLAAGDAFFEGNPFAASLLLDEARAAGASTLGIFLSPLSRDEVLELRARRLPVDLFVAEVMRRKLRLRMLHMKGAIAPADLADIERRASSAYPELMLAQRFDFVLVNHDGEGSGNWDVMGYPVADARKTLHSIAKLLEGSTPDSAEHWAPGDPL